MGVGLSSRQRKGQQEPETSLCPPYRVSASIQDRLHRLRRSVWRCTVRRRRGGRCGKRCCRRWHRSHGTRRTSACRTLRACRDSCLGHAVPQSCASSSATSASPPRPWSVPLLYREHTLARASLWGLHVHRPAQISGLILLSIYSNIDSAVNSTVNTAANAGSTEARSSAQGICCLDLRL